MALPEEERAQWSCRGHVEVKGKVRPPTCHGPRDTCHVTRATAECAKQYAVLLHQGT